VAWRWWIERDAGVFAARGRGDPSGGKNTCGLFQRGRRMDLNIVVPFGEQNITGCGRRLRFRSRRTDRGFGVCTYKPRVER